MDIYGAWAVPINDYWKKVWIYRIRTVPAKPEPEPTLKGIVEQHLAHLIESNRMADEDIQFYRELLDQLKELKP